MTHAPPTKWVCPKCGQEANGQITNPPTCGAHGEMEQTRMAEPQQPTSHDPACNDPDCSYRPEVIHLHETVVRYREALDTIARWQHDLTIRGAKRMRDLARGALDG